LKIQKISESCHGGPVLTAFRTPREVSNRKKWEINSHFW